jgi:hypothetical protein
MRCPGLILAITALLLLALPSPMQAGQRSFEAPRITSVTITGAGGTWPYCQQASDAYSAPPWSALGTITSRES